MPYSSVRVVIVDVQELVATALQRWLNLQPGIECPAWAPSVLMLAHLIEEHLPDVVLMDAALGSDGVIGTLKDLRDTPMSRRPRTVVLSACAEPADIDAAVEAGAYGFVSKLDEPDAIAQAVRAAALGEMYLAPTVQETLRKDMAPRWCGPRTGRWAAMGGAGLWGLGGLGVALTPLVV